MYFFIAAEEPPKKKKKKKKASSSSTKKQSKVIKPDATSKAATKTASIASADLSEAILGNSESKNTMKVRRIEYVPIFIL